VSSLLLKGKIVLGWAWGKGRLVTALILLLFILLRLVHLQIRDYTPQGSVRAMLSLHHFDRLIGGEEGCRAGEELLDSYRGDQSFLTTLSREEMAQLSWFVAPGLAWIDSVSCKNGLVSPKLLVGWGQYLLIASILLAVLTTRFLTSSWLLSLSVGAFLLYRDHSSMQISEIGVHGPLSFLFTLWFASSIHFFKTGAVTSFVVSLAALFIGSVFDLAFGALAFGMPMAVFIGYFFRGHHYAAKKKRQILQEQGLPILKPGISMDGEAHEAVSHGKSKFLMRSVHTIRWMAGLGVPETPELDDNSTIERGGLFRTLNVPFGYWIYRKFRWRRLLIGSFVAAVLIALLDFALIHIRAGQIADGLLPQFTEHLDSLHHLKWWVVRFGEMVSSIDGFYFVSLGVVLVCAFQSPSDGLVSFYESVWLQIIAGLVLLLAAFVMDILDDSALEVLRAQKGSYLFHLPSRDFFAWTEPIFITLGVTGVYNLVKVADSRSSNIG
jgi:hypothetical protein